MWQAFRSTDRHFQRVPSYLLLRTQKEARRVLDEVRLKTPSALLLLSKAIFRFKDFSDISFRLKVWLGVSLWEWKKWN